MYLVCIFCTPDLLPLIVACNTNALHVLMSEREPSVLWLRPCNPVYPGKIVTSMAIASDAVSGEDLSILYTAWHANLGLLYAHDRVEASRVCFISPCDELSYARHDRVYTICMQHMRHRTQWPTTICQQLTLKTDSICAPVP